MFHSIWSKGTWPGPSIMTWTPRRQARSVSSPRVSSSASWASSVASARPPGRRPSPIENITYVVPALVHDVFPVVGQHPFREERPAAGYDADEAVLDVLEVGAADAGV